MSAWTGRLSAVIVNYDSAQFARACARSLVREWTGAGRPRAELDVVVVDNDSPRDAPEDLAAIESDGVTLIRARENGGYAGGINLGLRSTRGGPGDAVAMLNPDLVFLRGSLERLLERLAAGAAAVAPRAFVDPARTVQLPPIELPSVGEHCRTTLAQCHPALGRAYSARRSRRAERAWSASEPFATNMLSGACLLLRRVSLEGVGGGLDERYPLYYEDTDLCRRLHAQGERLEFVPRAHVVHHWSRSAGVGTQWAGEPQRRHDISRAAYLRRWHSPLARRGMALADACLQRRAQHTRGRAIHVMRELGRTAESPELSWDSSTPFLLELSTSPVFFLAGGTLGMGTSYRFPEAAWEWFFQGPYFVRVLERGTRRLLGAWSFEKSTPARTRPLGEDECGSEPAIGVGEAEPRPADDSGAEEAWR